jgi:uncharacterized protein (DUF983 family)
MSGILQTCPRCDARWVRVFWHMNLHRYECTACGQLADSDLRRQANDGPKYAPLESDS